MTVAGVPEAGKAEADTNKALDALDRYNPQLNAVAARFDAAAVADAGHRDQLATQGTSLGPLHGLPFVAKDIIDVAGVPTRSGSLTCAQNPPADKDAPAVMRLRAAGAIPIAKANTVEFAIGSWGTNETVGTPVNPWDMTTPRVPGGSSSGTGVLVGSGLVPAGLGTDTGGSVRIPAALCGCVGHKSSIGLVSRTGVTPLSETLDTVGPLTATVELAAHMLAVMQGPDNDDPTTLGHAFPCPIRQLNRGIQGLRLACLDLKEMPHVTDEVAASFDVAVSHLREAGATITQTNLPLDYPDYQRLCGLVSSSESYATYAEVVEDPTSKLGNPNRTRFTNGKTITAAELVRIRRERAVAIREFETVIDNVDAIVLPTIPMPAIPISEVDESIMPMSALTRFVNYLELAALTVPINLTPAGLPTALQIVVRRFDDPLALRIGQAFEAVRGPFAKPELS
ncbi:MAG: amidase [Pseudomonadota bacterium]